MDFWNIGLRQISHLLTQISKNLSDEKRINIKKEWVKIFFKLFKLLLKLNTDYPYDPSLYLLFILKK